MLSVPVMAALAMWFLYEVLGWRYATTVSVVQLWYSDWTVQRIRGLCSHGRPQPCACLDGYAPDGCAERENEIRARTLHVCFREKWLTALDRATSECKASPKVRPTRASSWSANPQRVAVMSVLRMVKLFGWEGKVKRMIDDKRENELNWIWRRKVLGLIFNILQYVVVVLSL